MQICEEERKEQKEKKKFPLEALPHKINIAWEDYKSKKKKKKKKIARLGLAPHLNAYSQNFM